MNLFYKTIYTNVHDKITMAWHGDNDKKNKVLTVYESQIAFVELCIYRTFYALCDFSLQNHNKETMVKQLG